MSTNFSWIDWTVVGVYIGLSSLVGVIAVRFIRDMSDFVVAGRSLRSGLGVATMIGTELGLVTIMFAGEKGFTGGFAAFHIAVLGGVVALVVGWTGYIVVPLRRLGVMTIPEYYERRFSRGVRVLGGLILAISGILNMGLFLNAGARFVVGVSGLESTMAIQIVMTVLLVLVLVYTMLGGMVSIIITDYVQFVVLAFGLLISCVFAIRELGWQRITHTVERVFEARQPGVGGVAAFDPFASEEFGASYVIWMVFLGLVSCAVWQTAVLRACAARDEKAVRSIYRWSSIGFLVRFLIPNFLGICALVWVTERPELSTLFFGDGDVEPTLKSLDAMPRFLGQLLPTGLLGLVTAGMLAAFMSTHDSYLLCWSSVLVQDVLAPCANERFTTQTRLVLTRVIILLIGVFLLVWGLWYPLGDDLWDYMAITGAMYSTGAFALLGIGLYWKGASRAGAYASLLCGLLAVLGVDAIRNALEIPYTAAEIGLATVTLSVVALLVVSLLFPDAPREPMSDESSDDVGTSTRRRAGSRRPAWALPLIAVVSTGAVIAGAVGVARHDWRAAWGWLLLLSFGAFALISLVVSVIGARDLVELLRSTPRRDDADDPAERRST